jgi:hypothetical protein
MRMRIVILLVVVVVVGGFVLGRASAKAGGLPQQHDVECTVPKVWGSYKGAMPGILIFEDNAGTLRAIDAGPCEAGRVQAKLTIRRQ